MICNQCGNEVPDTVKFCNKCGNKIVPEVSEETVIDSPEQDTKEGNTGEYISTPVTSTDREEVIVESDNDDNFVGLAEEAFASPEPVSVSEQTVASPVVEEKSKKEKKPKKEKKAKKDKDLGEEKKFDSKIKLVVIAVIAIACLGLIVFGLVNLVASVGSSANIDVDDLHLAITGQDGLYVYEKDQDESDRVAKLNQQYVSVQYMDEDTFYFMDGDELKVYDAGEVDEVEDDMFDFIVSSTYQTVLGFDTDETLYILIDDEFEEVAEEVILSGSVHFIGKDQFVFSYADDEDVVVAMYKKGEVEDIYTLDDVADGPVLHADKKSIYVFSNNYDEDSEVIKLDYKGNDDVVLKDIFGYEYGDENGFVYTSDDDELGYFTYTHDEGIIMVDGEIYPMNYADYLRDYFCSVYVGDDAYYYYDSYMDDVEKLAKKGDSDEIIFGAASNVAVLFDYMDGEAVVFEVGEGEIVEYDVEFDDIFDLTVPTNNEDPVILLIDEDYDGYLYNYETEEAELFGEEVESASYNSGKVIFVNDDEELMYYDGKETEELMDDTYSATFVNDGQYYMALDLDNTLYVGKAGKEPEKVLKDYDAYAFFGSELLYLLDIDGELYAYDFKSDELLELDVEVDMVFDINLPWSQIDRLKVEHFHNNF